MKYHGETPGSCSASRRSWPSWQPPRRPRKDAPGSPPRTPRAPDRARAGAFAELVALSGRIKVLVFPGGTLGADEVSIAALQAWAPGDGLLNSGDPGPNQVGAAVFDLPLLFSGDGEADAILDTPLRPRDARIPAG